MLLATLQCFGRPQYSNCLNYEPAVVSLNGTLTHQTFPGPPNYEDISKGDKAETSWFLQMDSPICVNQAKSDPDLNPAQTNIGKVQLVIKPASLGAYQNLLGKNVVATGTLYAAHTGHHHAPVLLAAIGVKVRRPKQ